MNLYELLTAAKKGPVNLPAQEMHDLVFAQGMGMPRLNLSGIWTMTHREDGYHITGENCTATIN